MSSAKCYKANGNLYAVQCSCKSWFIPYNISYAPKSCLFWSHFTWICWGELPLKCPFCRRRRRSQSGATIGQVKLSSLSIKAILTHQSEITNWYSKNRPGQLKPLPHATYHWVKSYDALKQIQVASERSPCSICSWDCLEISEEESEKFVVIKIIFLYITSLSKWKLL